MNTNFQKAIIAVRSGNKHDAQHLLANALHENPADADAWLLLSYLVDSTQRQRKYLKHALTLVPDHPIAQLRLEQVEHEIEMQDKAPKEVAKPLIQELEAPEAQVGPVSPPSPEIAESTAVPAIPINPPEINVTPTAVTAETAESPSTGAPTTPPTATDAPLATRKPVGAPKRATAVQTPMPSEAEAGSEPETTPQPEEEFSWLTTLLLVLIFIAVVVLAYLVYTIITG